MRARLRFERLGSVFAFGVTFTLSAASQAEWRDDSRAGGDDVVDNRSKVRRTSFDNDDPFADSKPDPVAKRQSEWKPGFGASYGGGWAFGTGPFMKDRVTGQTFIWGDLGWWPTPHLFAGMYLSGGYVLQNCDGFDSCSGWSLRAGPELVGRLLPFEEVTPWLGVATGLEFLWLNRSAELFNEKTSGRGFELVNLRAGVDVRKNGQFIGVFASYSIAKYQDVSYRLEDREGNTVASGSGDEKKTHGWLSLGVRGTIE